MSWETIITGSLGVSISQLVMIGTFFFGLIIAAKNFKIAAMVWVTMFFGEFVAFYLVDHANTMNWEQPMIAWFIGMVFMTIVLLTSYWKYEDRRKIIV
jgi:hypothetical protein